MTNYVNNAYDKCLKPCDAQQFSNIINSPKTEELITLYRSGDSRAKPNLPALTYMGVIDEEKYKKYVKQCREQGVKEKGSRCAEYMRPTGLLMLDFDHVGASPDNNSQARLLGADKSAVVATDASLASAQGGVTQASLPIIDSPVKLWEYIQEKYSAMSESPLLGRGLGEASGPIALAHITPSGDGLRVVVKRPVGMTIEQAQYEWCQAMELDKVGIKPDAACKDISRLSFAPMQKEILYFNPSLLFGCCPRQATILTEVSFRELQESGVQECRQMLLPRTGACFQKWIQTPSVPLRPAPLHSSPLKRDSASQIVISLETSRADYCLNSLQLLNS